MGEVFGCPHCQGLLSMSEDVETSWRCAACGCQFGVEGGLPLLLRAQDQDRLAEFASSYRRAREQEGWLPASRQVALELPFAQPAGVPALYWRVRAQSYQALMRILSTTGPRAGQGAVADLGAGNGWLTYRLAEAGYEVLAVDASADEEWGLGAARRHYASLVRFRAVVGDLEHPPLRLDAFGLIIFNASLHYAENLESTLSRATNALASGGRIIVMDSPVSKRPVQGTGKGDRHLGQRELHETLVQMGLNPRWVPIPRGVRWWVHQAKSWWRRAPLFAFPMIVADRLQP